MNNANTEETFPMKPETDRDTDLSTTRTRRVRKCKAAESTRERLLAALGGSAEGWIYEPYPPSEVRGQFTHCACGQRATIQYYWQHRSTGRWVVTGSACVRFVPELDPAGLEAIRVAMLEREREQRDVRRAAKLAANAAYEDELRWIFEQLTGPGGSVGTIRVEHTLALKTPERRLENLEREVAMAASEWAEDRMLARYERDLRAALEEVRRRVWLSREDWRELQDLERRASIRWRVETLERILEHACANDVRAPKRVNDAA